MKNKRTYRKKKNNPLLLFIGLLVVSLTFAFSVRTLSNIKEPQNKVQANGEVSREEFIDRISPHAKELQQSYGVLPSIIIGQAILESNWGQSKLASKYNNLFGIKAFGNEKKVKLETREYVNEEWITIQGEFIVYDTWEQSMDDHTRLFVDGVTWNPRLYEEVLLAQDYEAAANALQQAGYATDPTYAEKVIHVIETYELYKYDH